MLAPVLPAHLGDLDSKRKGEGLHGFDGAGVSIGCMSEHSFESESLTLGNLPTGKTLDILRFRWFFSGLTTMFYDVRDHEQQVPQGRPARAGAALRRVPDQRLLGHLQRLALQAEIQVDVRQL